MLHEMISLTSSARKGTVAVLYWYLPPWKHTRRTKYTNA
jgi:hypothetical protein